MSSKPAVTRATSRKRTREPEIRLPSNTSLVRACLGGNPEAWSELIDRYKNLIYSIPVKYGLPPDDAAEIFQAVCVELLSQLPKLRQPEALPKWILQVTAHKCFHWKRQQQRVQTADPSDAIFENRAAKLPSARDLIRQAQEEQALREALAQVPPRCRRLIEMLFFDDPPRPYQEIAEALGMATGSIGFIRQRCLDRLRKSLMAMGFE